MSEPFIGEIKMFAGTFAPRGWALCDGQLLAISQNDALFSLVGTTYGGDGQTTFGLPDLRGRVPIHAGSGPGLTPRSMGTRPGRETVTLATANLPSHAHNVVGSSDFASDNSPLGELPAATAGESLYNSSAGPSGAMDTRTIGATGSGRPVANLMPYICVNFIIALVGVYPSRA